MAIELATQTEVKPGAYPWIPWCGSSLTQWVQLEIVSWAEPPKSSRACSDDGADKYQCYYECHQAWLAARGDARERITLLADSLGIEREYRQTLHRLEERPLMTAEQLACVTELIAKSKCRQLELLDRIREPGPGRSLLERLAFWCRLWEPMTF